MNASAERGQFGNVGSVQSVLGDLNVWKRHHQRAVHKPLLVLLMLGRLQRGEPRMVSYADVDAPLRRLLKQFGPSRKTIHTEYPFWRLKNERSAFWELHNAQLCETRASNTDAKKSEMLKHDLKGGFTEAVQQQLLASQETFDACVQSLLDSFFPESFQRSILAEVGIRIGQYHAPPAERRRDSQFRRSVLRAYEHRCAICNFDLKLEDSDIVLEAAHIKAHCDGGPDQIDNGLALCVLHHRAFDRGAISLDDDFRLLVSSELYGQNGMEDWFLRFMGKPIKEPQELSQRPRAEYMAWHRSEYFRLPARGRPS